MAALLRHDVRRLFVVFAVAGYALVAILMKPPGQIELFPFFNWSLFSTSTDRKSDTTLLIRSIDGHPIEPPQLFFDMKDEFSAAQRKDSRLIKLVDKWAYALRHDDAETAARLRSVVEDTFMSDVGSVEYDVVRLFYNPLQRLRLGTIDSIKVLGTFAKVAP